MMKRAKTGFAWLIGLAGTLPVLVLACGQDTPTSPKRPPLQATFDELQDNPLVASEAEIARASEEVTSVPTQVEQVDPATLTCADVVDFQDVAGGSSPGTNYDGILASGVGNFAERFAGQTLTYQTVGGYTFDALSASATNPLTLEPGAVDQNVSVWDHIGTAVLTGSGPFGGGWPAFNAIGEGAIAALFKTDQAELALDIVGVDGGGSATIDFFRRDASTIESVDLALPTGGTFAFRRVGNVPDIAGISIHNTDPAGVAYDNFCLTTRCTTPGPNAGPDREVLSGDVVTFDASGSSCPDLISRYEWSFGDGQTAEGISVTHRFRQPNTYEVQLTIEYNSGQTATDIALITVRPLRLTASFSKRDLFGIEHSATVEAIFYWAGDFANVSELFVTGISADAGSVFLIQYGLTGRDITHLPNGQCVPHGAAYLRNVRTGVPFLPGDLHEFVDVNDSVTTGFKLFVNGLWWGSAFGEGPTLPDLGVGCAVSVFP